ncbi:MAG: hypothetical protein ABIA75_02975 [Candidatus Neomarinimicrobiota bacterium]
MDWQMIVCLATVAVATALLIRQIVRQVAPPAAGGCEGCGGGCPRN